jgi:hypothetical protein
MLNLLLTTAAGTLAAAVAFAMAPSLLGRSLSVWEVVLCGGLALASAGCVLRYRKRLERKRLIGMRDSALW